MVYRCPNKIGADRRNAGTTHRCRQLDEPSYHFEWFIHFAVAILLVQQFSYLLKAIMSVKVDVYACCGKPGLIQVLPSGKDLGGLLVTGIGFYSNIVVSLTCTANIKGSFSYIIFGGLVSMPGLARLFL